MIDFKAIKCLVTAREAAEHYGLTVDSRGMALCPFHDDHNPSMKLDERFHCFGCGEDGDVIDFTAKSTTIRVSNTPSLVAISSAVSAMRCPTDGAVCC